MEEAEPKEKKSKPVRLRMRDLPVPLPKAIWLKPEHLPEIAKRERRGKVFKGEVFEVPSMEEAQEYLDKFWFVEIVK